MSIKFKNVGHYLLQLVINGTISVTGVSKAIAVAPFDGFITNITATLGTTANGAATTTMDINKNGTSIYSAAGTQLAFAGTAGTVSYGTLTTDPVAVSAGDKFTLDVDGIGNSHVGCYIGLLLDRRNPGASSNVSDLQALPK